MLPWTWKQCVPAFFYLCVMVSLIEAIYAQHSKFQEARENILSYSQSACLEVSVHCRKRPLPSRVAQVWEILRDADYTGKRAKKNGFVPSVDCSISLFIDPRRSDQVCIIVIRLQLVLHALYLQLTRADPTKDHSSSVQPPHSSQSSL